MKNKELRWYKVEDDEYLYIVGASSPSKAKIFIGSYYTGNLSAFESLKYLKCNVLKEKVSIQPNKDGCLYEDIGGSEYELLETNIYGWAEDIKCPTCGSIGKVYYDGYYYCDNDNCTGTDGNGVKHFNG